MEARSRCGERAWEGPGRGQGPRGARPWGGGNQELGRGGATVYGDEIEGGEGEPVQLTERKTMASSCWTGVDEVTRIDGEAAVAGG